ncbi:hypothetical protein [uncultured Shewanella sp.]|uniref:hypothetical protein n=1 Tax=uncultured Shewanella sp. TaxID=173975 RepID=UPI00261C6CFC|nr:hypothetical protein [uncultured Shewanella sp.]
MPHSDIRLQSGQSIVANSVEWLTSEESWKQQTQKLINKFEKFLFNHLPENWFNHKQDYHDTMDSFETLAEFRHSKSAPQKHLNFTHSQNEAILNSIETLLNHVAFFKPNTENVSKTSLTIDINDDHLVFQFNLSENANESQSDPLIFEVKTGRDITLSSTLYDTIIALHESNDIYVPNVKLLANFIDNKNSKNNKILEEVAAQNKNDNIHFKQVIKPTNSLNVLSNLQWQKPTPPVEPEPTHLDINQRLLDEPEFSVLDTTQEFSDNAKQKDQLLLQDTFLQTKLGQIFKKNSDQINALGHSTDIPVKTRQQKTIPTHAPNISPAPLEKTSVPFNKPTPAITPEFVEQLGRSLLNYHEDSQSVEKPDQAALAPQLTPIEALNHNISSLMMKIETVRQQERHDKHLNGNTPQTDKLNKQLDTMLSELLRLKQTSHLQTSIHPPQKNEVAFNLSLDFEEKNITPSQITMEEVLSPKINNAQNTSDRNDWENILGNLEMISDDSGHFDFSADTIAQLNQETIDDLSDEYENQLDLLEQRKTELENDPQKASDIKAIEINLNNIKNRLLSLRQA